MKNSAKPKRKSAKPNKTAKPVGPKRRLQNQARVGTSKLETLTALLKRPEGASLAELCKATGWQPHSVRGALSGTMKKKMGLKIISAKTDGVRTYRIAR